MASARKFVLITGCSAGGIGSGLAEVFRDRGYHVFATLRTPSKIAPALSKAPNVTVLTLDVLSRDSIEAAVADVRKQTGGTLDVLVNNSGSNIIAPALDTSIDEGKRIFDLNVWAPMAMVQAFAPLLIKAKGCVVNNTSANAVVPMPLMSVYNSSKAALAAGSETWRLELAPLGVRVLTLITLAVKTNAFARDLRHPIPETSYYHAICDFIHGITDGRLQKSGISTTQYATSVVDEVEKGSSGTVWLGASAFAARWGWALSPRFVRDMLIESIVPFTAEMAKVDGKSKA